MAVPPTSIVRVRPFLPADRDAVLDLARDHAQLVVGCLGQWRREVAGKLIDTRLHQWRLMFGHSRTHRHPALCAFWHGRLQLHHGQPRRPLVHHESRQRQQLHRLRDGPADTTQGFDWFMLHEN